MRQLHLIRHAPTAITGRYIGHTDAPCVLPKTLDMAAAAPLKNKNAFWIASDLQRAVSTAQWLQSELNLDKKITRDAALREQDFGAWENQSYDAIYQENQTMNWSKPETITPPEGESFMELITRVSAWYEQLPKHDSIVMVGHAGSLRALTATLMQLNARQALSLRFDTGSISKLTVYDEGVCVDYLNRPLLITGATA